MREWQLKDVLYSTGQWHLEKMLLLLSLNDFPPLIFKCVADVLTHMQWA